MNIPSGMRVIEIREPGGIDVLVEGERPVPKPTQDQVLIRVAAAGVNRADAMQRKGVYPMPPGWLPTYLGSKCRAPLCRSAQTSSAGISGIPSAR